MLNHSFPAKVLLLGEYTILNGSKALALPYFEFSGQWSFEVNDSENRENSQKNLKNFLKHQKNDLIDVKAMEADLEKGLWFASDIPQGYGMGSSGAVIAAIFQRYGKQNTNAVLDKKALARLEDFFHGSSSGLDPLVSHVQRPFLFHSFEEVEVLKCELNLSGFFLLNTGKPRQTGPLVSIYQEKLKDPQFKQGCAEVLAREVNFAIDCILKDERENLFHHLWHISKFQWDFFPEMIPTKERALWARGIESGDYVLKLCGAGGGGYLLGYSDKLKFEELKLIFGTQDLRAL